MTSKGDYAIERDDFFLGVMGVSTSIANYNEDKEI